MYYYVLIVFSLRRESLKLILTTDPFRGGSVSYMLGIMTKKYRVLIFFMQISVFR
jgi:hypothetical protein